MTTGPVRASSEWLRLREPADAAARASELVEKVPWYLPTHAGAGTLLARLPGESERSAMFCAGSRAG